MQLFEKSDHKIVLLKMYIREFTVARKTCISDAINMLLDSI